MSSNKRWTLEKREEELRRALMSDASQEAITRAAEHVREARLGLIAAVVAGFGAVISEVGAVMMVGGNISGETRVMTTAIVLETRRGNFSLALSLGLILLSFAFVVNYLLTHLQQRERLTRLPW